jgi:hypothetical protein
MNSYQIGYNDGIQNKKLFCFNREYLSGYLKGFCDSL